MDQNTKNTWKQPIPVYVSQLNGDNFGLTLFQKILTRCRNEATTVYVGDTPIKLDRGQCIVGRFELANCFGLKRKESMRIQRKLSELENSSKLLSKRKSKDCTIVTVLNYDDWVSFEQTNEQSVSKPRANHEQTVSTNKNVRVKECNSATDINTIFSSYKEKVNSESKLTVNGKAKIKNRLKSYSLEELVKAIDNFSIDEWWMTNNSSRGIAWFFNSDDRIDQFLNLKAKTTGEYKSIEEVLGNEN